MGKRGNQEFLSHEIDINRCIIITVLQINIIYPVYFKILIYSFLQHLFFLKKIDQII